MIALDFTNLLPVVSSYTMTKIFAKTLVSVVCSPVPLLTTILVSFGVAYMISGMIYNSTDVNVAQNRSSFTKKFFIKNKVLVSCLFLLALLMNVAINSNKIVTESLIAIKPYDLACTFITQKEIDAGYDDEKIRSDMKESGCNPVAFAQVKTLYNSVPKPKSKAPQKYFHNQYGYRDNLES